MIDKWYVIIGSTQHGPLSEISVRNMLKQTDPRSEVLLRRKEDKVWKPLDAYPQFAAELFSSPQRVAGLEAPTKDCQTRPAPRQASRAQGDLWQACLQHVLVDLRCPLSRSITKAALLCLVLLVSIQVIHARITAGRMPIHQPHQSEIEPDVLEKRATELGMNLFDGSIGRALR